MDFIASAAYDLEHNDKTVPTSHAAYVAGCKEKIRTILRMSANTGHDSVVLGAFGCGAFGNKPDVTAKIFKDVMLEPEFQGHFREIAFGVINDRNGSQNYSIFKKYLENLEIKKS